MQNTTLSLRLRLASLGAIVCFTGLLVGAALAAEGPDQGTWTPLASSGDPRQEVSFVASGGQLYLAGGSMAHEKFNPAAGSWTNVAPLPVKLDHIQGVAIGSKIYYPGGLSGFPGPHSSKLFIYDTGTNTFSEGASMGDRGRGAGGVAVRGGKLYYAGGLHTNSAGTTTAVKWFDVYDPATNVWTELPDMPTARDHFHGAVLDGSFWAIGGRNKSITATTPVNESYSFSSNSWTTGHKPLPGPRGGFGAVVSGCEILIIGGEGGGTFNRVDAYRPGANSWRTLTPMPTARHGIQAAELNGQIYVAAGGRTEGGGAKTDIHERFTPPPCPGSSPPPTSTATPPPTSTAAPPPTSTGAGGTSSGGTGSGGTGSPSSGSVQGETGSSPGDSTRPSITRVTLSRRTFVTRRGDPRYGTRVRLSLSERATLRLTVERAGTGRRLRGTLRRRAGAGRVSVSFAGRLGDRPLSAGRYVLRIVATDAAGNTSGVKRAEFRIAR